VATGVAGPQHARAVLQVVDHQVAVRLQDALKSAVLRQQIVARTHFLVRASVQRVAEVGHRRSPGSRGSISMIQFIAWIDIRVDGVR
jgi:hypothetical protein